MLPDALDLVPDLLAARAAAGRMLLGLDFDGTLAPIVPRPEDAALPARTRPLLEALAARSDTTVALISGRGLADLAVRVGIPDLFYAGNHGLEIEGPGVARIHEDAAAARHRLDDLERRIRSEVGDVPGAIVEHKGLTLSIHYRMTRDAAAGTFVRDTAHRCAAGLPGLRTSDGKMVVEIRPDVDWHKGRALRFLCDVILAGAPAAPVLFVGDDLTDEDAFREIRDRGWGIVVGARPETAASAALASTDDVVTFLQALAEGGPSSR
jgi:trehalose 6-phosphate phosphatase